MMDYIAIPAVVGMITYAIYKLFELFVCRRERLAIIDKLSNNFAPMPTEKLSLTNYFQQGPSFGALKAGLLLLGIGLGLLIGFFICANTVYAENHGRAREMISIIYGSCTLLFGGIGLVAAFLIELNIRKKRN